MKWDVVLNTESILTDESKAAMWTPMVRNNKLPYPYGFGWSIWQRGQQKIIDHTGITGTQFTKFVDAELTVIVLTNLGRRWGGNVNSWGLGPEIANMLGFSPYLNKDYTTISGAKMIKAKTSQYKKVEGVYTIGNTERKLYTVDTKLIYDRGNSTSEMVLLDDGRYLMLGVTEEWILEIKKENNDRVTEMLWHFNGQPNSTMIFKSAIQN